MPDQTYLPWLDIETNGLNPATNYILEIGFVITDDELNVIDSKSIVISDFLGIPNHRIIEMAPTVVQEMHAKSGLWDEIASAAPHPIFGELPNVFTAQEVMRGFIHKYFGDEKPPLCGSSVHFDRGFLASQTGSLLSRFSHRNIDVSSIKELAQRWAPATFKSRPGQTDDEKAHRAIPDCLATIAELQHYIDSGFICPDVTVGS